MNQEERFCEAVSYVSPLVREVLLRLPLSVQQTATEIRLRAQKPVVVVTHNGCFMVEPNGQPTKRWSGEQLVCSYPCLEQTFRAVCGYSVHTHQRDMVRGFIPLKGGHRVGLGATAVEKENGVTTLKEISSLNIRIARQVFGIATAVLPYTSFGGLLMVGRPATGKTTLLRDLTRLLSGVNQIGGKVVLLDERGELAAMWDGIPQNDVGLNTDVLNGFAKAIAMEMAVRSLSPDWVVCDEIGSQKEAEALLSCMHAGVGVIASVHANNMEELRRKTWVMALLRAGVFAHIALLDTTRGKGNIERIYKTDEWLNEGNGDSDSCICCNMDRIPHCRKV